jgi:hypothetical protein
VGHILERVGRVIQRENGACKAKALWKQGFSGKWEEGSCRGLGHVSEARTETRTVKKLYSKGPRRPKNVVIMKLTCFRVLVYPCHRKSGVVYGPPLRTSLHQSHRITSIRWLRT